jgi:HK97 gp10 family phage protein
MEGMIGQEELEQNLENIIQQFSPDEIEGISLAGAEVIAEEIRTRAPLAKKSHYKRGTRVLVPPGNLRRGVVAKVMQRIGQKAAPAIAAMDYRIAPHAHLVEYGTVRAGPHPFFRPGFDSTKAAAMDVMAEEYANLIDEAVA